MDTMTGNDRLDSAYVERLLRDLPPKFQDAVKSFLLRAAKSWPSVYATAVRRGWTSYMRSSWHALKMDRSMT
jgi:hypothetical protein